jgi:exodeoxyribonuclease-3
MKLVSWNVNGLRAAHGKGFLTWLQAQEADLVFLQETKATEDQLDPELRTPPGWRSAFHSGERKGYSGVAVYWREGRDPDEVLLGMGDSRFDAEGRVIGARYGDLVAFANYFPNGGQGPERVAYKLEFYAAFLASMNRLREQGRRVCVGGDYNTAHREIDLARPKENETISGFLPEERAWIDRYVDEGWLDTFRHLHPDERDRYSWWSWRMNSRARNIGWRIDYWFVDAAMRDQVLDAWIREEQQGSDHAPVGLELG